MEKRTIRKLRGAAELVTDAVDAATTEAQRAHEELARRPYAVLARIEPIAGPAKAIESLQFAITRIAYETVRAGNAIVGAVVTTALDRLEREPARPGAARPRV
ncbi:MAG: hypothetical protein ABI768_07600 [Acidobacteriota bacterium]